MRPSGGAYDVVAAIRDRFVQGPVDLVWVRTGVAWHRLGPTIYLTSFSLTMASLVLAAAFGGFGFLDLWSLAILGVVLSRLVTSGIRFSRAASRDPFLSCDPLYRASPHRDVTSTLALVLASFSMGCFCAVFLWAGLALEERVAASDFLRDFAYTSVRGLAYAVAFVGILVSGCSRSTKARRREATRTRSLGAALPNRA